MIAARLCLALVLAGLLPGGAANAQELGGELSRALIEDSDLRLHFRTYYFDNEETDGNDNEAWAAGGWISYQTGWFYDVLQLGAVGYTSQPLFAPENKDGTQLLELGQEGYTVLGQAYVSLKVADQVLSGGRQSVDQPEVNPQDNRMTPNTFEGVTLGGEFLETRYTVGYLTAMKQRNSDEFLDFADVATAINADEPMWLGGFDIRAIDDFSLRGSAYYVPDVLVSSYSDLLWKVAITDDLGLRLGAQFMYQTGTGDDLLTGPDFDTWVGGLRSDLTWRWLTLRGAVTKTSEDGNYRSPYGSWPGYTKMIVKDFDRADEIGWLVGATIDLSKLGVQGLSVDGAVVFGGDAVNPETHADVTENTEFDVTVRYDLAEVDVPVWLKPVSLRGQYAHVDGDLDGATSETDEVRLIFNYEWRF